MIKIAVSCLAIILAVQPCTVYGAADQPRELFIVAESFPPYEFIDATGKIVGIDIDMIEIIFKRMGVSYKVAIMPWARAWYMIEHGKADAVLSTSRRPERGPFLIYPTEDMWVSEYVFFARREDMHPHFNGYEDALKGNLKIGITRGNSYHDSFWKVFPYRDTEKKLLDPHLEEAVDVEMNMRKLAGRRVDLVIVDRIIGLYQLKLMSLHDRVDYYRVVLFSKGYTMPFARKSTYPGLDEMARRFQQELAAMKKSPAYREIQNRWIGKVPY